MPLSNIRIIHQDAAVLVVDKPTLLLSVPGRADDNKDCLITRLQEKRLPGSAHRPSSGLGNLRHHPAGPGCRHPSRAVAAVS